MCIYSLCITVCVCGGGVGTWVCLAGLALWVTLLIAVWKSVCWPATNSVTQTACAFDESHSYTLYTHWGATKWTWESGSCFISTHSFILADSQTGLQTHGHTQSHTLPSSPNMDAMVQKSLVAPLKKLTSCVTGAAEQDVWKNNRPKQRSKCKSFAPHVSHTRDSALLRVYQADMDRERWERPSL